MKRSTSSGPEAHSFREAFISSVRWQMPIDSAISVSPWEWRRQHADRSAMDEQHARPATLEDLKTLIRTLNEHGVDYLLIGAYALAAHGYYRATTDIDLLVPASAAAGDRVKRALMTLPDRAAAEIDPAWFEEGENIRVADAFVIDIMLNANGETFETLSRYAETIELDGLPVRTVDLEGLLKTKQTLREKDVPDRLILEEALLSVARGAPR